MQDIYMEKAYVKKTIKWKNQKNNTLKSKTLLRITICQRSKQESR